MAAKAARIQQNARDVWGEIDAMAAFGVAVRGHFLRVNHRLREGEEDAP
jgi:hypothetical protein